MSHTLKDAPGLRKLYKTSSSPHFPRNLVLYGPPGTGKTYQTLHYALAIIEGSDVEKIKLENESDLIRRYQQYCQGGQIEFITFHANYAYQDFMSGIRPDTQAGSLLFEQKAGIFKRISDRARSAWDRHHPSAHRPSSNFADLLHLFLSQGVDPETEQVEIALSRPHRIFQSMIMYDMQEKGLLYYRRTKHDIVKQESRELQYDKLEALYRGNPIRAALHQHYYESLVLALKQFEEKISLAQAAPQPLPKYVLIMDEMNRANLSAVFGELITLIEENKRYGQPQGLSLSLSNGEKFSVPDNLYLIGTMNTADRNIARLDYALRRRFHFQGCFPEARLIRLPRLRRLLEDLNQAIAEEKQSADLLIGHAYFMHCSLEELPQVMNHQIIPLLQEYFPNRPDLIRKILKASRLRFRQENYQFWVDNLER